MPPKRLNGAALLAGDIGATKTNLALFGADTRAAAELSTFQNEEYGHAYALLEAYLGHVKGTARACCLGVAGPVKSGRVQLTNLPWALDAEELKGRFGFDEAWLINDLQATAQSVPLMRAEELHTLNEGVRSPEGSMAVIAPGTGLGEGFLAVVDGEYHALAAEGGHSDFAPRSALQKELLTYLEDRFEHVSYELICSGLGLPNIYAFLVDSGRGGPEEWLAAALAEADDPTPVIVEAALDSEKSSSICREALKIFVDVLAAEAGNLALKVGATGGVYLAGGIPPRILELLEGSTFMSIFADKGDYQAYLNQVPVHVMLNSNAALLGAADYGLRRLAAR